LPISIYYKKLVLPPLYIPLQGNLVLQLPYDEINPGAKLRRKRGTEPCQSVVIMLALRLREHDWKPRLIEERAAQQEGAYAGGARAARAFGFRCPVLIPLGAARSVPNPYKCEITQWFMIILKDLR
jgi:hypothetical protein